MLSVLRRLPQKNSRKRFNYEPTINRIFKLSEKIHFSKFIQFFGCHPFLLPLDATVLPAQNQNNSSLPRKGSRQDIGCSTWIFQTISRPINNKDCCNFCWEFLLWQRFVCLNFYHRNEVSDSWFVPMKQRHLKIRAAL